MSNPVTEARRDRTRARDAVGTAAGRLAAVRAALASVQSRGADVETIARIRRAYEAALAETATAKAEEARALASLEARLSAVRGVPADGMAKLDAGIPVAFFPVRIETRFLRHRGEAGRTGELRVRIYPDSILANEHEPLLTGAEGEAGREYWRRAWIDGGERDAWTILLKKVTAPRAAWIVSHTTPVNVEERPASGGTPEPRFVETATRPDGWHRAPEARGLPEHWIVSAFRGGIRVHQALSRPVRQGLALTFRLSGEGTEDEGLDEFVDLTGDGLEVEPSVLWAYDYDEAVEAGMAVTIPLSAADLDQGFSQLIVIGVRTSEDPLDQAGELAEILQFNNYTRGVAFVPQGAKTNNSAENPSDYPPADTAGAVTFSTYRGASLAIAGRDGARFAQGLGLDPDTAGHFWGADRDERAVAVAMGDCLWPATLGYFLREMMAPHVTPQMAEALRTHMHAHVQGRGPFAAFRVGPAPYGLLPVGRLLAWPDTRHDGRIETAMPAALKRLAPIWLGAAANAPRIGRSGDPDADLVATLAMDASAQGAQVRRALGYDAIHNLWNLFGLDLAAFDAAQAGVANQLLTAIGEPGWNPRILHLNFTGWARDFAGPLIEDAPLSETERLTFNYLNWLRTADLAQLEDQQPPVPVNALLYLMLRHGLLCEFDASARQLLDWRELLHPDELHEAELVDVATAAGGEQPAVRTAWDRLETRLPDVTGDRTVGEFLNDRGIADSGGPAPVLDAAARLAAFRDALLVLEDCATAELDRLFTETLDITSHRLDAWLVGLYAQRLEELRGARPKGIYIGAYGWVTDLVADPPALTAPVTTPENGTAQARTDSAGYVCAPSMLHAAAAAVLRSAYLARSGADREPYAFDLSSRRVRTALWLIDTVREDQPLGAALGYQFERGLHERHPGLELDKFIDAFRAHYPLVAEKAESSGASAESVAARNVVDGLRLNTASREGSIPFGSTGLAPSAAERTAIDVELARLDDAIDAVGDLMTAEAVYQVIKGSTAGVAASLDTLAKGSRAPEIEIATTPRSGTVVHQRVAIVFGNVLPSEWAAIPPTPRATAAPELNAWLGTLFGSPDGIACTVEPEGGTARDVTIADLGLQPIDLFDLARRADTESLGSDFDRRIAWHVAGATGPDANATIDYDAALAPSATTFAQAFEMASAIGCVLGFARPLAPADLLPPELESRIGEADLMASEVTDRTAAARAALLDATADLETALSNIAATPAGIDPDLAPLRAALVRAAGFGVSGAFPPSRHDASAAARETLASLGTSALAALVSRRAAADAATTVTETLGVVIGRSFGVIPRFRPAAPEILGPALASEPDLDGHSDADIEGWFAGLASVREPVGAWRQLRVYQRAQGRSSERPRIVQVPLATRPELARWACLPFAPDERPRSGLVSLAIFGEALAQPTEAWSGLLLDSWPELVPNVEEDSGVVFHYDTPGAQAPQAVLLAVPPPGTSNWSFDLLEGSVLHALELARIRAVDLACLPQLGQILPTAFLAANPVNATIATSFAGLLRNDAVIVAREP